MNVEDVRRWGAAALRPAFLNTSLVAVILGLFLGLMMKFFVPVFKYSHIFMNLPGVFLLRVLHVVTTPLLFTNVVTSVSGQKSEIPSAFFVSAAFLSMTLGLSLVLSIKPGSDAVSKQDVDFFSLADALLDVALNIVPRNIILDCSRQIFTILNEATQIVVDYILGFLSIGLVFMATSLVVEVNDWEIIFKLGKFMGVVVFGLVIQGILVLPLIYFLCVRRNPYAVIKGFFPALMTAFVSSSSSATLPFTFKCCEERLKIDKKISRLHLPSWSNNGTIIYEVVAVIFIVQLNHINLDFSQLITIAMTSVSSIGATGIPARGVVTTFFILAVVDLPAKEVCLLVVTQYLLDRCNTAMNVLGDCFGVALIHQESKRDLGHITVQRQKIERMHGTDVEDCT